MFFCPLRVPTPNSMVPNRDYEILEKEKVKLQVSCFFNLFQ